MKWCKFVHIGLVGSAVFALAACGIAGSHAPVPEFMRAKEPDPPPQSPPDVKQLIRDQLDSVFVSTSSPHDVRVSRSHHHQRGQIVDRRRADDNDKCTSETYQPS
jgi:hypothetical protein